MNIGCIIVGGFDQSRFLLDRGESLALQRGASESPIPGFSMLRILTMYTYIYIYIYVEREREIDRERDIL